MVELLIKIGSAVLSIGAILLVLFFIDKMARKRAERMNELFKKQEEEQVLIEKKNKKLVKSKK